MSKIFNKTAIPRSFLAVKKLSGGGVHQDKRTKRERTRSAAFRNSIKDL